MNLHTSTQNIFGTLWMVLIAAVACILATAWTTQAAAQASPLPSSSTPVPAIVSPSPASDVVCAAAQAPVLMAHGQTNPNIQQLQEEEQRREEAWSTIGYTSPFNLPGATKPRTHLINI